jgi:hypothetical protein
MQFRLVWELEFHGGRTVRQYSRNGDQVFQVYLTRMDTTGAKVLHVFDALRPRTHGEVYRVEIPPGGRPEVVYTSHFTMGDEVAIVRKVYTFGWRVSEPVERCEYHHIDPDQKRVVVNQERNRSLPWG